MRRAISAIAASLLMTGVVSPAYAQTAPAKPVYDRLDATLNDIVAEAARSSEFAAALRAPVSERDMVAVSIRLTASPSVIRPGLLELGLSIANEGEDVIEAYVPVSALSQLASLAGVTRVDVIVPPITTLVGQGAAAHNSPNWSANGYTGAGVKVGIIDEFGGYASLIGSEVPAPAGIRCYTAIGVFTASLSACGTDPHGTAVAEALIDIAPNASLYIANPSSRLDLLATVQWMASQGVRVINFSRGYTWDGPGDGSSPYSDSAEVAVTTAVSAGIVWVGSAGNSQRRTWIGPFTDNDADNFLEFAPGTEVNPISLSAGQLITVQARWDDSWTNAARDIDIKLYSSSLAVVAASLKVQDGLPGRTPFELFSYVVPSSGTYYVVIDRFGGAIPAWIQIQAFRGPSLTYWYPGYSINNPADNPSHGSLAVGATAWYDTSVIESFSSLGPTIDGRSKPDVVGVDRADSVSYGFGAFQGTSQASPHVAGMAALVRQAFPSYTPAQVATYIKGTALARGTQPNNTWGYGLAWLPTIASCTYAINPPSATFSLPGGTGTVSVTAPTGCGWTAVSNNPAFITVTSGASGTGNGVVGYSVGAAGGARTGTITIAGQTFTITQTTLPVLALAPSSINMAAVNNGGGTLLSQTLAQTLALTQAGAGTVTWTASANQPWLTISPTFGSGPANLTLTINNAGNVLPVSGTRTATVTVTTTGAANNPTATVSLQVYLNGTTAVPIGQVDTPSPGVTNVTGSIAVTGWAIDDVGVVSTKICRLPVVGESAPPNPHCNNQAQIFIGDGTFIRGARPDVAAAFPTSPQKDRAGWGYLMLTNFLPNAGNGTFTLVTWVNSSDGQTVRIDARAITCTNASATAPFGAIDTPEQGGTASGASYVNFGWVLAAQPAISGLFIPTSGATVQVYVDGISRGVLDSYNNPRPDIQALFPGYTNTNGAVGVKFLNTTTLANGLHTIFWIAADNVGTAAGIGSRFFTVANSSLVASARTDGGDAQLAVAQGFSPARAVVGAEPEDPASIRSFVDAVPAVADRLESIAWLRHSDAAVPVTHGFDPGTQPELVMPDAQFVRVVRTVQLDRVLIDLSAAGDGAATYRGYTVDGELLRGLPVGSTLDAETGHFAWAVGLGFGGSHDLMFVRTGAHGSEQIRVRVEIAAESASKGEPRLVIDTPLNEATVGRQFTIAGWAFDPNGSGTGVDTLHVWAYPAGGGDPHWVGVAGHGGLRPDVGNAFGARFARSGYSIEAAGLAPGTYDIVVYAHSTSTNSFRIARSVRVTLR